MADEAHPIRRMLQETRPPEPPREVAVPTYADYAPAKDRMAEVRAAVDQQLQAAVFDAVQRDPINHVADMHLSMGYGNAMIIDRELSALFKETGMGEFESGKVYAVLFAWAQTRAGKAKDA